MAAPARIPAGQDGRYRNRSGGTSDARSRQPPELAHLPGAIQRIASVRDDPAGRITLMERCYHGPFGKAPRHLPFRWAALSFTHRQLQRGVLQPPFSDRPGSPWWRAVNERILRDGGEAGP